MSKRQLVVSDVGVTGCNARVDNGYEGDGV